MASKNQLNELLDEIIVDLSTVFDQAFTSRQDEGNVELTEVSKRLAGMFVQPTTANIGQFDTAKGYLIQNGASEQAATTLAILVANLSKLTGKTTNAIIRKLNSSGIRLTEETYVALNQLRDPESQWFYADTPDNLYSYNRMMRRIGCDCPEPANARIECVCVAPTNLVVEVDPVLNNPAFEIVVEPWRDASTTNYYLQFPTTDSDSVPLDYDFTIDWGDGTETYLSAVDPAPALGPQNHIYDAVEGERFTISIVGICPGFEAYGPHDTMLHEVSNWGTQEWIQLNAAFSSQHLLTITAPDTPNLSQCTDVENMFNNCDSLVDGVEGWDLTGPITSLKFMFYHCDIVNFDLGTWTLGSNVTDCSYMFDGCYDFNGNVSGLDTGSVTNFERMFYNNRLLTGTGFGDWDVSSGTIFDGMFLFCEVFNGDVTGWTLNTTVGADISMNSIFYYCLPFDQDLDGWDVSEVTDMRSMFGECVVFNQDLNSWDMGKVLTMGYMFDGCIAFNGNITAWRPALCSGFHGMFYNCTVFNQPIGVWSMGSAYGLEHMFRNCIAFNQPLDDWDVSEVRQWYYVFAGATSFNQDLNSWVINTGISESGYTFEGCTAFNGNITSWDVSGWSRTRSLFSGCTSFNQDLDGWDISSVSTFTRMFKGCTSFNQALPSWVTTSAQLMDEMFMDCTIFNQSVDHFDLNGVTDIDNMFEGCTAFNQPLNSWDTGTVNYMGSVFKDSGFNGNITAWDVGAVQKFTSMFENCPFNQDISGWILSVGAYFFANMFKNNTVFDQDISGWDMDGGGWTGATYTDMFLGATAFSTANYDLLLNSWAAQSMPIDEFCTFSSQYTIATSQTARDYMTVTLGWTLTDLGGI